MEVWKSVTETEKKFDSKLVKKKLMTKMLCENTEMAHISKKCDSSHKDL